MSSFSLPTSQKSFAMIKNGICQVLTLPMILAMVFRPEKQRPVQADLEIYMERREEKKWKNTSWIHPGLPSW